MLMKEIKDNLPNMLPEAFDALVCKDKLGLEASEHAPRILMLYGSVRKRSYSRLAT
ncbi:arsenical resistance protein ArsH [Serratia liquefaciens]|nr:arsenical resistance protein ArsH [Serratia liquefaciens]